MKNVVITGSTRGIGFSMAIEFLRAGCNVTLSGRGEALIHTALLPFGENTSMFNATSRKKQVCKISGTLLWHSGGEIDIWINNAGQNTPHMFSWQTAEAYSESIIHTNITGMIYGSQIAAAGRLKQGITIQSSKKVAKQNIYSVKNE